MKAWLFLRKYGFNIVKRLTTTAAMNGVLYYMVMQNIVVTETRREKKTPPRVSHKTATATAPVLSASKKLVPGQLPSNAANKKKRVSAFAELKEALEQYETALMFTLTISENERQKRRMCLLDLCAKVQQNL